MKTKQEIKDYIVLEFIPNGNANEIKDDLDLIASGIIDSLGVLKLMAEVEKSNGIELETEEMDFEKFSTINSIYSFIDTKVSN